MVEAVVTAIICNVIAGLVCDSLKAVWRKLR